MSEELSHFSAFSPASYEAGEAPGEFDAHGLRRRLAFVLIGLLCILLLVVTPPLIKLNRYAKGIALSMSQSLGRPVHLDSVSLGLLPVPHLTLENVVVSEDPAFGNEPTIRANTVEANLRLSALWRRPMEFSRVRFLEPSVNLVRNAEGHWNLEGVLVHAARVNTAPTAQQHRGGAPRFPYIEAGGGRVNIKIGDDKTPFSLTDTEFALWLPSPDHWNVRLRGTPARTDTNMTDPGVVRIEGSLERAAHMEQVPVSLQLSWHNAPLGEATRLLSGTDQGWRGTVHVDASVTGSLGAGRLTTDATVDDLRRADFVPAQSLSLHVHCVALADTPHAELRDLACTLPAGGAEPLRLQAERVDLTQPSNGDATLQAEAVPLEWFASWARLLSHRFPSAPALPGTVDANLSREEPGPVRPSNPTDALLQDVRRDKAFAAALNGWEGSFAVTLPLPAWTEAAKSTAVRAEPPRAGLPGDGPAAATQTLTAELLPGSDGRGWQLSLAPTAVQIALGSIVTVAATGVPAGYQWRAAGQAEPARVLGLAKNLPPFADGLAAVLAPAVGLTSRPGPGQPANAPPGAGGAQTGAGLANTPVRFDVSCSRGWSAATGDQLCSRTPEAPRRTVKGRR